MFVCNDDLLRYATEFKQYSGDVAIACGLLCLALRGPSIAFAVCGSLAVWMSHASAFVLCGLGLVLFVDRVRARRTREVWSLVAIAGAWLSSFAVLYLVHLRLYMGHRYLHHFWEAAFAPFPPSTWRDLTWYGAHASELIAQSGMQRWPALVAIVVGVVSLWREHRGRDLALLLAPVVIAFLVSAARLYPLEGRFTLYLVPSVTLLITQGVAAMLAFAPVHRARRMTAVLAGVAIVIVILLPLPRRTLRRLREPIEVSDARSVVSYLLRQREATDMVYVDASITPAYEYYSRADARAWMRGSLKPESMDRFVRDLVSGSVAWILCATGTPEQQTARAGLLARIEQKAECTEERCGAHAWLGRYRVR